MLTLNCIIAPEVGCAVFIRQVGKLRLKGEEIACTARQWTSQDSTWVCEPSKPTLPIPLAKRHSASVFLDSLRPHHLPLSPLLSLFPGQSFLPCKFSGICLFHPSTSTYCGHLSTSSELASLP